MRARTVGFILLAIIAGFVAGETSFVQRFVAICSDALSGAVSWRHSLTAMRFTRTILSAKSRPHAISAVKTLKSSRAKR